MFNPTMIERIRHQIDVKTMSVFSGIRRKQLDSTDFTIIANNCWGGVCYEYYGLPKQSSTVGTYFFAEDYINFIENFEDLISRDIEIIQASKSRHYAELLARGEENVPVGKLAENVEIVFLHYKDPILAKDKWNRRIKRINLNNLIFKFSYMNNCTPELIKKFDSMNLTGKKIAFVRTEQEAKSLGCGVYYPGYEKDEQISNDTFYWNRYFDVSAFLNGRGLILK